MLEHKRHLGAENQLAERTIEEALLPLASVPSDEGFRRRVKMLAQITPPLRQATQHIERSWSTTSVELRKQIWITEQSVRKLLASGNPQPKNFFEKVWLGFDNDVRVTLWEFVEASLHFLNAVDKIVAVDDQANWERTTFYDPAYVQMHERSLTSLAEGNPVIFRSVGELRKNDIK